MQMNQEKTAFDFENFKAQAIADMKAGKSLIGKDGVFTPLMKEFLEAALEGEMTSHMTNCLDNPDSQNRRNGKTSKTIHSPMGAFDLETPRDREGSFEPQIVKKRQTVLNASLDNKILGLYSLGMSYQDIISHLKEMYDDLKERGVQDALIAYVDGLTGFPEAITGVFPTNRNPVMRCPSNPKFFKLRSQQRPEGIYEGFKNSLPGFRQRYC